MPSLVEKQAFKALKQALDSYHIINAECWQKLQQISHFKALNKGDLLYCAGQKPNSFSFIYSGLMRVFICDEKGSEYNKNFFPENSFPGSMAALLEQRASDFSFEALEDCQLIEIDFGAYRELLKQQQDLMLFQIYYLEKNWLLSKDAREVEIVQLDAGQRYQKFMRDFADINQRIPQYHIASHLGVTPTQLSRIRAKLK